MTNQSLHSADDTFLTFLRLYVYTFCPAIQDLVHRQVATVTMPRYSIFILLVLTDLNRPYWEVGQIFPQVGSPRNELLKTLNPALFFRKHTDSETLPCLVLTFEMSMGSHQAWLEFSHFLDLENVIVIKFRFVGNRCCYSSIFR